MVTKIEFKLQEAEVEPKQIGIRKYLYRPITRLVSYTVVTIETLVNPLQSSNDDKNSIHKYTQTPSPVPSR